MDEGAAYSQTQGSGEHAAWPTEKHACQDGLPPSHCTRELLLNLERLREFIYESALYSLKNSDLADDVAQESITRVLARILNEEISVDNLSAYCCGVARHVIYDMMRRESRKVRIEVDGLADKTLLDGPSAPWNHGETETLSSLVIQEIERLPEADRGILIDCFVNGFSCAEVGRKTGEPAPRIRKRKSRALRRLRDKVRNRPEFSAHFPEVPH